MGKRKRENEKNHTQCSMQKIDDIQANKRFKAKQKASSAFVKQTVSEVSADSAEVKQSMNCQKAGRKRKRLSAEQQKQESVKQSIKDVCVGGNAEFHQHNHNYYNSESLSSEADDKSGVYLNILNINEFNQSLMTHYLNTPLIELLLYSQKKYPELYRDKEGFLAMYYTQLTIIQHDEKNEQKNLTSETSNGKTKEYHDHRLATYEDLYGQQKAAINIEDIFKKNEEDAKEPKRLLILGRAGIGKSTLMRYMARKHHELWPERYDTVILLPLRRLQRYTTQELPRDNYNKRRWIAKFIHDVYFISNSEIEIEHIEQVISTLDDGRTLYLLDGYDEAAHLCIKNIENELPNYPIPHLLLGILLNKPNVIVSTRPHTRPETEFDRELENMGFNDEQIGRYVQGFFSLMEKIKDPSSEKETSSSEPAKECYDYLKQHPSIWGTCHVPIGLELVVSIWQRDSKTLETLKNMAMTSLYQEIVFTLQKNYLTTQQRKNIQFWKPQRIEKNCEQEMQFLQYLTFTGLMQPKSSIILSSDLIITALEEFKIHEDDYENFITRLCQIGLLKQIGGNGDNILTCDYYFIHLTFQEYFAVRYLSELLLSEHEEKRQEATTFIKNHKYEQRLQYLLWFTVGLLNLEANSEDAEYAENGQSALNRFFETFFQAPRDLIGDYEALFLMRSLEEGRLLEKLDERYLKTTWQSVLDIIWRLGFVENNIRIVETLTQCSILLRSNPVEKVILALISNLETKRNMISLLRSVFSRLSPQLLDKENGVFDYLVKILKERNEFVSYPDVFTMSILCDNFNLLSREKLLILNDTLEFQIIIIQNSHHNLELMKLFFKYLYNLIEDKHFWSLIERIPVLTNDIRRSNEEFYQHFLVIKLFVNLLIEIPHKAVESLIIITLPTCLRSCQGWQEQFLAASILSKYIKTSSSDLAIKLLHEVFPSILPDSNESGQGYILEILLENVKKISDKNTRKRIYNMAYNLLKGNDVSIKRLVADVVIKNIDIIEEDLITSVVETLPNLLRDVDDICDKINIWIFDDYIKGLPQKYLHQLTHYILPVLLNDDEERVQFYTAKIIIEHISKFPNNVVKKVILETLPKLFTSNVGYLQNRSADVFYQALEKISLDMIKDAFKKTHLILLTEDGHFQFREKAINIFKKFLEKLPNEIGSIMMQETLPFLFENDTSYVSDSDIYTLSDCFKIIRESIFIVLIEQVMEQVTASKNINLQLRLTKFILYHNHRVPKNIINTIMMGILPKILTCDQRIEQDEAAVVLFTYASLVQEKALQQSICENSFNHLKNNNWFSRYELSKLLLVHGDENFINANSKLIISTLEESLNGDREWWYISNAVEILFDHAEKYSRVMKESFFLIIKGFINNNYKSANRIIDELSRRLMPSEMLISSIHLQSTQCLNLALQKARDNKMMVFLFQEGKQVSLCYGQQTPNKISFDSSTSEAKQLLKSFNYESIKDPKLYNNNPHYYQILESPYPLNFLPEQEEAFSKKDKNALIHTSIDLYRYATSKEFSHYPNRIAYQKAYDRVLSNNNQPIRDDKQTHILQCVSSKIPPSHYCFYTAQKKDKEPLILTDEMNDAALHLTIWLSTIEFQKDEYQNQRNLYDTEPYFIIHYQEGDCLFASIAAFVPNETAMSLRRRATQHIEQDQELKNSIITLINSETSETLRTKGGDRVIKSFQQYIMLMQTEETWGTAIEIVALARSLQRPIAILTPKNQHDYIVEEEAYQDNEPIFLNYVGEIHYAPLSVPADKDAKTILQTIREAIAIRNNIQQNEKQSPMLAGSSS